MFKKWKINNQQIVLRRFDLDEKNANGKGNQITERKSKQTVHQ
jgi:hypothetical protein